MSMVENGRISSNDQRVDKKVFDKNMDGINWKSNNGLSRKQSTVKTKDR